MQIDVVKAQAGTLVDWIIQWRRSVEPGSEDVAMMLHKAARQMAATAGFDLAEVDSAIRESGSVESDACGGGESVGGKAHWNPAERREEVRQG
jgi:hypothetical protein